MIEPGIDHVGLNVSNPEESIRFYERLFGFEVIQKRDEPGQAFVGKNGVVPGLMESPDYSCDASPEGSCGTITASGCAGGRGLSSTVARHPARVM